ncbi:hypothetical protein AB1Y20_012640 [Prymnesium parvum]|uniref:Uncharacterized protein n=1 Tax=Prymnesium parvum TaxID=97485 RepID=A0AB34IJ88_PRYPA
MARVEKREVMLWSMLNSHTPPLSLAIEYDGTLPHLIHIVCLSIAQRFRVPCTPKTHTLRLWDDEQRGFTPLRPGACIPREGPIKVALAPLHPAAPPAAARGPSAAPLASRPPSPPLTLQKAEPKPPQVSAAADTPARARPPEAEGAARGGRDGEPRGGVASGVGAVGLASSFWKLRPKEDIAEFPLKTINVPRREDSNPSNVVLGELIGLL